MSTRFADWVTDRLEIDSAVLSSPPITMACWFKYPQVAGGVNLTMCALADKDSGTEFTRMFMYNGAPRCQVISAGNNEQAAVASGITWDVWGHSCAVFANTSSRSIYLNGGGKVTNSNFASSAGLDRTSLGRTGDSSPGDYFFGWIAEMAIWNAALTDAEVLILSKGYSPLFVRPQNLAAYWPLLRGIKDKFGIYNLTASGTTVGTHSRIIMPCGMP